MLIASLKLDAITPEEYLVGTSGAAVMGSGLHTACIDWYGIRGFTQD